MKGVVRIDKSNKLNPQYAGPFEILERIRPLAYRLALPPEMERIHDVFHVSQLRKYIPLVMSACNNSYQLTFGMQPFEAQYGRQCKIPNCWKEVGERGLLGPDLV